jgi:PST family polysaccharide transporter
VNTAGARSALATRAARGAAWTIGTGIGARALGLAGTLALTYFVARDALGEVSDAAIAVAVVNQLSTIGVGQYYVARPSSPSEKLGSRREIAQSATIVHLALGMVALAALMSLRAPLAHWMRAPALGRYLPGLALAALVDRVSYMPERVLARELRFRVVGVCRTVGELSYTVVSVTLAALGSGAMSIVAANVARSLVRLLAMALAVPRADWLALRLPRAATVRSMLRFGVPTSVGIGAGFVARRVDNAIVSSLFGVEVVSAYNLAYNLADVPAVQVGEQIGDVLLPSFAYLRTEERKAALLRSTGLLALVTFPLAVGLAAIAPTLVDAVLRADWRDTGPMLAMLSVLSVVRPVGWTISSYLLARDRPRLDALLEVFKVGALVVLLLTIGPRGPLWACAAVGAAFALHALASMAAVDWLDGIRVWALALRCVGPLIACMPMAAAVVGVRLLARGLGPHASGKLLVLEVATGALTYPMAALLLARPVAADMVALLRRVLRDRAARTVTPQSA